LQTLVGCGIPVRVFVPQNSRVVVDVMSKAQPFPGLPAFETRLPDLVQELEAQLHQSPEEHSPEVAEEPLQRPEIGPLPTLDSAETLRQHFIGRERLLSDYEDMLRGLAARWRGTPARRTRCGSWKSRTCCS